MIPLNNLNPFKGNGLRVFLGDYSVSAIPELRIKSDRPNLVLHGCSSIRLAKFAYLGSSKAESLCSQIA